MQILGKEREKPILPKKNQFVTNSHDQLKTMLQDMIHLKRYVVSACPKYSSSNNRYAKGQGGG